ncbi:BolA/IbaG family iron-sulfur metabolism protein [bacterium]|nr:BolA/IbaG family iron-sulfur metabolism protein [bacterium]
MRQELTNRADRIRWALTEEFSPHELVVEDESRLHAGHAGARPEGETHFRIRIGAASLGGLSRVDAHRRINRALAAEFTAGLHALAIELV